MERRLGVEAPQALGDEVLQPISTLFVDEELHRTAIATVLAARRREVSLVDRVSFEVMRRLGFTTALPATLISTSSGSEHCPTETPARTRFEPSRAFEGTRKTRSTALEGSRC